MTFTGWKTRAPLLVACAFGVAALGDDCEGDIVRDPTFRDWCGSSLCAWKLGAGHVERVPTWNEYDDGVGFVDVGTQISQATNESSAKCVLFTSVADIDPAAAMTLSVDFNSDGSFEYTGPLGATQWQKVELEITAPSAYQGITFALHKAGSGTAVLAEMRVRSTSGCIAPAVVIGAGSLAMGEKCSASTECAPGLTCTGAGTDLLCSQCSSSQPCAGDGGVVCAPRSVFLPSQCGPGAGLGAPGAPCLAGSDCASGDCGGALTVPLADEAGACDLDASLGPGNPANCRWYGARGGACR